MLEDKLPTRFVQTHPSSNRLFSESRLLEQHISVPADLLQLYLADFGAEEDPHWASTAAVKTVNGLSHASYVTLESLARLSESAVRLTGRGIAWAAQTGYSKLDPTGEVKSFLQKAVEKSQEMYQSLTDRLSTEPTNLSRRQFGKDLGMAGLSLYVLIKSGQALLPQDSVEELQTPPPVAQPEPYRPQRNPPPHRRTAQNPPTPPSGLRSPYDEGPFTPEPVQTYGQLPIDPINEFKNIDNILVYCADQSEKQMVLDTVRSRNRLRRRGNKLRINFNGNDGTMQVRDGDVRMNVVVQGQAIRRVNGGYDMIQLRGHTNAISGLLQDTLPHKAEHVIVYFGGCNSYQFIADNAREDVALIGGVGTAYGSQNTYMLLKLPREIDRSNSWQDLKTRFASQSDRVRNG
ncbi:MAG: hypothetical protein CMH61_02480 [Nanoarchaeota archaeon]|nr:hypothetical protein [Nanoarchaeota archaeon]|tara:strand:+ start:1731 stop:2942 length:1212 start_codon:yes stop_codon:yes gene_type:complete